MKFRAILVLSAALIAPFAHGANTPPLSGAWHIAPTGTAASSGELLFRVTRADGSDPTEVTVFVLSGTNDTGVASNIRRALNTQLRADLFNVEPGEGANVLLSSPGDTNFSLELVDSDVDNVRVVVQSATPIAPPTVPSQATPANRPAPATPPAPGDAVRPPTNPTPGTPSSPAAPPPNATPGGGPASAPPPNATPGDGPASAPPPNASPGDGPASAPPPSGTPGGAPASAPPANATPGGAPAAAAPPTR
jgi:hypothetical protein